MDQQQLQSLLKLTPQEIAKKITENPNMLSEFDSKDLRELTAKVNPYARSVVQDKRQMLFSFSNYKMSYLKTLQAVSLSMFFGKCVDEIDEWVTEAGIEDKEAFKGHLEKFSRYFLKYNPDIHAQKSAHKEMEGSENLPSLDFIARW